MTAELVFAEIDKAIKADPSVASKIGGVYLFKIGDKQYTLDLKSGSGVKQGAVGTPDCTLTVAEPDFVALMTGKANGQNLFMQGKLKIAGNMGLAMKLDKIPKSKPDDKPAAAPASSGASSGSSPAAKVFDELAKRIAANPGLVQQIGGVYQFNLPSGPWTVDLKNGKGSIKQGPAAKADCTLTTSDDDFVGMMTGKANSQNLFMQGKLKIAGNMGLAMKLNKLQQAKANL